jgi:hypothetical protein
VDWTDAQKEELLETGKVQGYDGHHVNNVSDHPEMAGDPNNVKFVPEGPGHLAEHDGDYRNPTSGPLLNRN